MSSQSASSGPSNTATETDSSSGTNVGLIAGIIAAVVIVAVAVIGFILWKKRRDEDEDSDDDGDRRLDPPMAEFSRPAPPPSAPTTYSSQQYPYQANARLPAPQVPITSVTSPVGGAAAINYSIPSSPESEAAKPGTNAAAAGGAAAVAARQGSYHFSDRSSDDEQDVWGNQVGSYREKRTHSNVSVEF